MGTLENGAGATTSVNSRCARCGAPFHCGAGGQEPCWCASLPQVLPVPYDGAGCYCPQCLEQVIAERQAACRD